MTYQEFKDKYNGKYVDVDGYPKNWKYQCFDLVQKYITEVLELPDSILAGCGNVCNMLYGEKEKLLLKYFDEVSVYEMHQGDICIWYNNHIAIEDSWDGNALWFFSQNPNPCQVMQINMGEFRAFRKKNKDTVRYINIPEWIDERYIYDVNTKEKLPYTLKPSKFGGLTYLIHGFKDNNYYAEIETRDYGRVLVRVTEATKISNTPLYTHGNF